MSSQQEPEVTPIEPPPTKSSKSHVDPTIWDRINSLGAISVTPMDSSTQGAAAAADAADGDADDAPLPPLPSSIDNILRRYQHLWADY